MLRYLKFDTSIAIIDYTLNGAIYPISNTKLHAKNALVFFLCDIFVCYFPKGLGHQFYRLPAEGWLYVVKFHCCEYMGPEFGHTCVWKWLVSNGVGHQHGYKSIPDFYIFSYHKFWIYFRWRYESIQNGKWDYRISWHFLVFILKSNDGLLMDIWCEELIEMQV